MIGSTETRTFEEARTSAHPTISANRVEGTAVYNQTGDKIGRIEDLMIEKISGRVTSATMTFGAFLGLGGDKFPVPWSMLDYDPQVGGYVIDDTRLKGAPSLNSDHTYDNDVSWRDEVYKYWAATPYWLP